LGLVLSALLIKDQNSKENSKTYLIMFSLTITELQGIIPKLMASRRGWFIHVRRDFERFASLGSKRIGDALLSSLLDPLEGLGNLNCGKLELGAAPDFQH